MSIGLRVAVPILRIFDEARARAFYLDFLGFTEEWTHRFEPGLPAYVRVRRDDVVLDLSEHHGDGSPGVAVWLALDDLRAFHAELHAKPFAGVRPGVDVEAPGGPTMEVVDPFSNTLRFCQVTG